MVSASGVLQRVRDTRAWKTPWWRAFGRRGKLAAALFGALLLLLLAAWLFWPRFGIWRRVVNETIRLPMSPPGNSPWALEEALPQTRFFEPTCVTPLPGSPARWLVLERCGTVQLVESDPASGDKNLVLDISDHVARTPYDDDGAVSLALHPEFGKPGSPHANDLFMHYTAIVDGRSTIRLSRFTWDAANEQVRADSETVLIDQLNENLWHNGGALAFGPDGFLYVGMGDEGTDADGLKNGQRLDRDLFCGILRIDVDCRGGAVSHAPKRKPETATIGHYYIPSDNPFVGEPGVLEEFWAHGLRNPFRAAFDSQGRLWVSEVGHLRREEINLVVKGGNYGWSYAEGTLPFTDSYLKGQKPAGMPGTEQPPLFEYPHLNGNSCVIGGFYYEGEALPELQGCYLYGDNGSGRIFALRVEGSEVVENRELLNVAATSKMGIAAVSADENGEPLVVVIGENDRDDGRIYRLVPAAKEASANASNGLPQTLSETGLFSDVATLTPAAGVYPYGINAPAWHDGARARYWIALPGKGVDPDPTADRIEFSHWGAWKLPPGTVLVQHLDFPVQTYPAEKLRRLETRILVRTSGAGVYGASYRWNEAGTEAALVAETGTESFERKTADGASDTFTWHFLEASSCLVCHNAQAGFVLGLQASQFKGRFEYPNGAKREQLKEWNGVKMFTVPLTEEQIGAVVPLAPPGDHAAPLAHRARSYLQANCAHCHRPGGVRAHFDARFETPLADQGLLEALPHACGAPEGAEADRTIAAAVRDCAPFGLRNPRIIAAGDSSRSVLYYRMATMGLGRMPLLGSRVPDRQGLRLMHQWITSLPSSPDVLGSERIGREMRLAAVDVLSLGGMDDERRAVTIEQMVSTTSGALALMSAIDEGRMPVFVREEIVAAGSASPNIEIRGLFQRFLPEAARDPAIAPGEPGEPALAIAGDALRGRSLVMESALQCRNCHRFGDTGGEIGPDLSQIGARNDREKLLDSLLHPSRVVAPEFRNWLLETKSGRQFTGLLLEETERVVTLRSAEGKTATFSREEIEVLEAQPLSLMPEGQLNGLTPEQIADILAYLESLK